MMDLDDIPILERSPDMDTGRPWTPRAPRRSSQFANWETRTPSPGPISPRAPHSSPEPWMSPERTPVSSPGRRASRALSSYTLDVVDTRLRSPRESTASSTTPPSMTVGDTEASSIDFRFSTDDESSLKYNPTHVRGSSSQPRNCAAMHHYDLGYGDLPLTPSSPYFNITPLPSPLGDGTFRNSDLMNLSKILSPAEYIRACSRIRDDHPSCISNRSSPSPSPCATPTAPNPRVVSAPPRAYRSPGRITPERPVHRVRAVTAPTTPVRLNVFPSIATPPSALPQRFIPLMDLGPERSIFEDDDDDEDERKGNDTGSLRPFGKLSSRLRTRNTERTKDSWHVVRGASDFFGGLVSCGQRRRRH